MPDYCMDCDTPLMGDEEFYCTPCVYNAQLEWDNIPVLSIWDVLPE